MNPTSSTYQNDTTPFTSLDDWITPSALQHTDSELASYWDTSSVTEFPVDSPIHSSDSRHDALTSEDSMPPNPLNDTAQSLTTTGVTVSPVFGPILSGSERPCTDLILLTVDLMLFYVDETTLCKSSSNNFGGFLPVPPSKQLRRVAYLPLLLSSDLHVMLQAIYDIPPNQDPQVLWNSQFGIENIAYGINSLPQYGIDPKQHICPRSNMYGRLLTCAALYPLDVYTLAAQHGMHDLAVAASSHLLSVNLDIVQLESSGKIEPRYFRRLIQLLEERRSLLAKLIATEPSLHDPTKKCGFLGQGASKKAWNQGVASLTSEAHPGITTGMIKETFLKATADIGCRDCLKARDERLRVICAEWTLAPRTI